MKRLISPRKASVTLMEFNRRACMKDKLVNFTVYSIIHIGVVGKTSCVDKLTDGDLGVKCGGGVSHSEV